MRYETPGDDRVTVTVEGPSYVNRLDLPTNTDPQSPEWRTWVRSLRTAIDHATQHAAFEAARTTVKRYALLHRPPSFATLPRGLWWTLVERPSVPGLEYERRTDLPVSSQPFGVFEADRPLTADELEQFEIVEVP